MTRLFTAFAVALFAAGTSLRPAPAAPPTVTPSPGYDARLQEQRKATSVSSPSMVQPATPFTAKAPRHRSKPKR